MHIYVITPFGNLSILQAVATKNIEETYHPESSPATFDRFLKKEQTPEVYVISLNCFPITQVLAPVLNS